MQVTSNGRVRRSPEEWRDLLARFARSGLEPRDFCHKEKVHLTSFQRWQKRLANPTKSAEFIDVTPATPDDASPWAIEIEFASGTVLRLRG